MAKKRREQSRDALPELEDEEEVDLAFDEDEEGNSIAPKRGKGNRPGWKSWNPSLLVAERNCFELLGRRYPKPLESVEPGIDFKTQSSIAEPAFGFKLMDVPTLVAEALRRLHPCVLYRHLWLDGLMPTSALHTARSLEEIGREKRALIWSPRKTQRASASERRHSSMAKLHASVALERRKAVRQLPLTRRNNTAKELEVIDFRLRGLKAALNWGDRKLALLIIEGERAFVPSPCPERIKRWTAEADESGPDPVKAERWLRDRLRPPRN